MKNSVLLAIILLLTSLKVMSQGTAQVIISGIPPVLPSPYVSDLESNFYQGQYHVQFIYNNTQTSPVEFVFDVRATKDGSEIVSITSEPVAYTPGTYMYQTFNEHPQVPFPQSPLDDITGELSNQIIQTGVLPEGSYTIEIEARPVDAFENIVSIPGVAFFEVRFPQPPVLISPFDESIVPPVYNVFTWTPVFAITGFQFEYEILIVEMFEGQTPLQAIQSNPEYVNHTSLQPMFLHTPEHLPLEYGESYAWMVTAREVQERIPLSDDGKTEIFSFTVGDVFSDIDFDDLEHIDLVPNFARITQLQNLEVTSQPQGLLLNGFAVLEMDFEDVGLVEVSIECIDLQIQMAGIGGAVATGGQVRGDVQAELNSLTGVGDIITLDKVRWSLADGLHLDARIVDPGGQYLEAQGTLGINAAGISGFITATGPGGDPLLQLGVHPLELSVNSLTAIFPGAYLYMDAHLAWFGEPTPCEVNNLFLQESPLEINFSCNIHEEIPLLPGQDLATLFLKTASGELILDWSEGTLEFTSSLHADLRLDAFEDHNYNIPTLLTVSSEHGVSVEIWPPGFLMERPQIDLGIAAIKIYKIENPYLSYNISENEWDFGLDMDVEFLLPDFDDLSITGFGGVTLDRQGIHFPARYLEEEDLQWLPVLQLAGFGARLTAFSMPEFTFPWFNWDGVTPGPWDFGFDFELTTPNFKNHLPSCLRNLKLTVENASFSGGEFAAHLPSTSFEGDACAFSLGAGYGITVHQLGGGIFGQVEGGDFVLDGYAALDATLTLGHPFACADQTGMSLSAENFLIRGDGILEGNLTNIIPPCPLKVGPFTAGFDETQLTFSRDGNNQQAKFEADAHIDFPAQTGGTHRIHGELGLDLITGDWYKMSFEINQPFVWLIPEEDEVLRFNIDQASISLDGLYIDGTQEFVVSQDHTISVDINELLLDLQTFEVKSGSIAFAEGFAFETGIDASDFSLAYSTRPLQSGLSDQLDPGLYFELAGSVIIDSLGLHTSGSADAQIRFGGFSIDDLTVDFSDDFAFGLDPFRVRSGQAEIIYNDETIAVIDPAGFHPSFGFFNLEAVIPERIPLPSQQIAYLVVKEDDELLIDIQQDPDNEFGIIISTKPDQSIQFVFPILQGNEATPPSLEVQFSDVKLSVSPLMYQAGNIHVSVPDLDDRFDLSRFGIPFSLEHIAYGIFEEQDESFEGLFFTGELMLFEEELGEGSSVTMIVDGNGSLVTNFELQNLDAEIPLVKDSDVAVLSIDSIAGQSVFHLLQPLPHSFNFTIGAGFVIKADEEHQARANVSLAYTQHGITLQDFEYDVTGSQPRIDIDPFIFQINEIHSLSLDWDQQEGFDFYAALDFAFGMRLEEDTLLVPLQGVEIRHDGFAIPAQEVNDGSSPPLMVPPLELMGFRLELLAFRTQQVMVNIFDFSPGDLSGLNPGLDFALSFPGLEEMAPQLEGLSLTVLDASYQNGRLNGTVEVHEPLQPITIPLGDTELEIEKFAGTLSEIMEEGISRQAIDIEIEGEIAALHQFETDVPCDPVSFSFAIVEGSGFRGTIDNFVPCGEIPIGSLQLAFTSSLLELDFVEEEQSAVLSGSAVLNIPKAEDQDQMVSVSGDLSMDLMTGSILDGALQINDAFHWHVPAASDNPFFTFTVEQARLDQQGLTLRAEGSLTVTENLEVDVSFNDLVFSLEDLSVVDGEAVISSDFAFELLFLPVQWQMVSPLQGLPDDTNVIRMDFSNAAVVLNSQGLGFSGQSNAQIQLADLPGAEDPDDDPQEPEDPDEDEDKFYDNLRLEFTDDFRTHVPPTSYAKSGRAEIWLDEDDNSTLLAWYDEDGLGIGDVLGLLPIPDTLGLPNKEIAYMVLKDQDGLLVELETDAGERTLTTREGKSVDFVVAAITDEHGNHPTFSTQFSITVNDAFEITGGSIHVDLENNPYTLPELPLKITAFEYAKREDGVAALTASALLDLPESLGDLQVVIDEIRFSEEGFEQATFHVGNQEFALDDTPEFSQAFADSALVVNIHYVKAQFGEDTGFDMRGTFQSNFFKDEETQELSYLPFNAEYEKLDNPGGSWNFSLDMDHTDTIAISYARFAITQLEAQASAQEFALVLSGVVSMPEILGDDFAVTIESLSIGTQGVSVGDISVDAQEQQFAFFDERVVVTISSISPDYDSQERVLYLSMDGSLEVLERDIAFSNMTIGTNGSFDIGDGLDVNLLTEDLVILENHLVVQAITFGIDQDYKISLGVSGNVTLPEPFDQSSGFTVTLTQVDRYEVDVSVEGPEFQLGEGFAIDDDRTQITLGDFATLDLTAVAVNIDFKNITNTTFLATAAVYIENDVDKRVEFGNAASIQEDWGFRYQYDDGFQWRITSTPSPGNPLLEFDAGFFRISVNAVATLEDTDDFGLELSGSAGITIPGIDASADYSGFRINKNGIDNIGQFDNNVTLTIMDKVSLSIGMFEFEPDGGPLHMEVETENSDMENPETEIITISTLQYLRIEEASITINGAGNGESGGFDSFSGGVDKVLFYQTTDGALHLYIDNAFLELGDVMEITASMRFVQDAENDIFLLSVAGTGEFSVGETGAAIGVAGKIEKAGDHISFGLFVRADVTPGIPIIPAIITLNGLGGGFYYRPDEQDFNDVRNVSGLTFLQTPDYQEGTRFAAFLYAGVGLIGEGDVFYVDGTFFFEITDQFSSMYVNGLLMGQPEENLFANMMLSVEYGDTQMFQGLIRVDVDYLPVIEGYGEIGFFAKKQEQGTVWAIYGNKSLRVLGAANMDSYFIVCNEGLLVDTGLSVYFKGGGITIEGGIEASIWYIVNSGFGAYGKIDANVSGYGVTVGGYLYGAYISNKTLFYAAGGVYVDVLIFSGTLEGWVAYNGSKWSGGKGSNPEYMALINSARQEAEQMLAAAQAAMDEVSAAQQQLNASAAVQSLMDLIEDILDNQTHIIEKREQMEMKIAEVNQMTPPIVDRLNNAIIQAIELQEEVQLFADEFQNPTNFSPGIIHGEGEDMVVAENPSINLSESAAASNESTAESYDENVEELMAYYREMITKALANLTELEMIVDGEPHFSSYLLAGGTVLFGQQLTIPVNGFTPNIPPLVIPGGYMGGFNPNLPLGFGTGGFLPVASLAGFGGGIQMMNLDNLVLHGQTYTGPSFNDLSEKYTEAVEAVKEFYATYIGQLWTGYALVPPGPFSSSLREAILNVIELSSMQYNDLIPGLETNHAAFTESLDIFYTIKAEMITTIYGMLVAYSRILEDEMQESELAEIQQMQADIAMMLDPPMISSFIIQPNYYSNRNRAEIFWNAQHPDKVEEVSYAISSEGLGTFTSAGQRESLQHYTFKRTQAELQRTYTMALRARGSGGNTSVRTTNITLQVDPNGQQSPGGEQVPDNVPLPHNPSVTVPYNYMQLPGMRRYWTNNPNKLDLTIQAYAPQSDIAYFEYAVGTSFASSNVVDWTTAVGVIEPVNITEGGVSRKINTSITGLNLEHNQNYYVSVRAYNTEGLFRQRTFAGQLRYDETAPETPELAEGYVIMPPYNFTWPPGGGSPTVFPQMIDAPGFHSPKYNISQSFTPPSFTAQWQEAQDPESGIYGYQYVISSHAQPSEAFSNTQDIRLTQQTSLTLGYPDVNYFDTLYLHVRSLNRAGTPSQGALTFEPFIAVDPTAPATPRVHVRQFFQSLRLFVTQLSLDPESQTKGYHYSVGTSPGATDVRGWSEQPAITQNVVVEPSMGTWTLWNEPYQVPNFNVPRSGLPHHTDLYINVRAVNNQGMYSAMVATGPFQLGTSPLEPGISTNYNTSTQRLLINITNIMDHGAPIQSVSYRVLSRNGTTTYKDWTNIPNMAGVHSQPGNVSVNPLITSNLQVLGYRVEVRVRNNAYQTTTATHTVIPQVTYTPPITLPPLTW